MAGPDIEVAIGERLAVRPKARNGPAVTLLFHALIDRALALGVTVSLVDAQPHLVLPYERLGFRPYLPPLTNPAGVTIPLAGIAQDDGMSGRSVRPWPT